MEAPEAPEAEKPFDSKPFLDIIGEIEAYMQSRLLPEAEVDFAAIIARAKALF